MTFEYDPDKDAANVEKHGLSLASFAGFDEELMVLRDRRHDYGEERFRAIGRIDGKICVVVYVIRDERTRLISFRRARGKELRQYERRGRVGR
jgi:uncharacterized protein